MIDPEDDTENGLIEHIDAIEKSLLSKTTNFFPA